MIRPLNEIAIEINGDCNGKPWYNYAKPYVQAMMSLSTTKDTYGLDSGYSVVSYALANLTYWRGDTARRVKAELKQHLKGVAVNG
jgi:hypothetical protein